MCPEQLYVSRLLQVFFFKHFCICMSNYALALIWRRGWRGNRWINWAMGPTPPTTRSPRAKKYVRTRPRDHGRRRHTFGHQGPPPFFFLAHFRGFPCFFPFTPTLHWVSVASYRAPSRITQPSPVGSRARHRSWPRGLGWVGADVPIYRLIDPASLQAGRQIDRADGLSRRSLARSSFSMAGSAAGALDRELTVRRPAAACMCCDHWSGHAHVCALWLPCQWWCDLAMCTCLVWIFFYVLLLWPCSVLLRGIWSYGDRHRS